MLILITGIPGSGKSTILQMLKYKQYNCIEIDDYVKHLYKINNLGYILIRQIFGKKYVNQKGVDTKLLKSLVLNNDNEYQKLKNLIWPLIKAKLLDLQKSNQLIVVEMSIFLLDPLYFDNIFSEIIIIDRPKNLRSKNESDDFCRFFTNAKTENYLTIKNINILTTYNYLIQIIQNFIFILFNII